METGLLQTKLHIPAPRPALVVRPHLLARLNASLAAGCKLTLISAPAGFGKTTLLSEWIHLGSGSKEYGVGETSPTPYSLLSTPKIAWLSLDAGDSHPHRFLAYLVAALHTLALSEAEGVTPDVGASVAAALQSPQPPPIEMLLTTLLNDIATNLEHIILILDDYHALDSRPVDEAVTFLLDHLPPHFHLVIASREDPNLPLSRLRARGQLTELRAADLRFTPAEAADFLNQGMGLSLSEEDVAALETRTEGWIAGLQLAALSLQGHTDAAGFIASFTGSHRFVLDYLLEEVLNRQPEHIQAFLLYTSILNRLCGPLCDAVLQIDKSTNQQISKTDNRHLHGQRDLQFLRFSDFEILRFSDSQAILESLDRANLFIVPLDNERRWYRYHQLFRDLLRQRLESFPPVGGTEGGSIAALHLRASVWYEAHGDQAEAFHHAIAAGDVARAADLAEAAWSATFRSYVQNTLFLDWMKALPDALIRTRPVLSAGYAWALQDVGALEAAETWLQAAERGLEAPATARVVVDRAEFDTLPATIAVARAYLAMARGDGAATARLAAQALALIPATDPFRRAGVMALLGLLHLSSGALDAAANAMVEGMELTHAAGSTAIALTGVFPLADIRFVQGRLREAEQVFADALALAMAQGEPGAPGLADLHLGLSRVYLERGDRDTAGQLVEKSAALDVHTRSPDWDYRACLARAQFREAVGDLDGALDLYRQAERLYHNPMLPDVWPLAARRACVWIRQGRLAEAQAWVQEQGLAATDDLSSLREFEHIVLSRVLLACFRRDGTEAILVEAMELLERLRQAAEAGQRFGSLIEILILQALAHQARGDASLALPPLERALALAEPEGYVRLFVDEGAPLAHLLSAAAARGIAPHYVARLLAAFPDSETISTIPSTIQHPPSQMLEPLSQRELEILQLIAQGLSNREIGAKLFLALDTVKGHNRRIYGKLQVQRRTEAIARARELGLL